ncbi:hypothetical protein NPIL_543631 [Nephila pilipes]|uniref:Uncharacterized protein n=1 Tax=Nephila pilipes TaxID=299642 RepID=A0A8X6T639_NEPPI|nr:hypothetical protein NPIL_543631 [Nephila pilipes]
MYDEILVKLKKSTSTRSSVFKIIKNIKTESNNSEVLIDVSEELLEPIRIYSDGLRVINDEIEFAVDFKDLDKKLKSATEYQGKIITWTFVQDRDCVLVFKKQFNGNFYAMKDA